MITLQVVGGGAAIPWGGLVVLLGEREKGKGMGVDRF